MKYLKPVALAAALLATFGLNMSEEAAASGRVGAIVAATRDAVAPATGVPHLIKVQKSPARKNPNGLSVDRRNQVNRQTVNRPRIVNPPVINQPRVTNRPRILTPPANNQQPVINNRKFSQKQHYRHNKRNRHKHYKRRYDNRGVFLGLYPYYTYDPYYDDPYYADPYYDPYYAPAPNSYRLSCREVIGLLQRRGYRHIQVYDCTGKVYTFVAFAGRKRYKLRIYSSNGSFKTRTRI